MPWLPTSTAQRGSQGWSQPQGPQPSDCERLARISKARLSDSQCFTLGTPQFKYSSNLGPSKHLTLGSTTPKVAMVQRRPTSTAPPPFPTRGCLHLHRLLALLSKKGHSRARQPYGVVVLGVNLWRDPLVWWTLFGWGFMPTNHVR